MNKQAETKVAGVQVFCAHTKMIDIGKVVGNPRNPNTHPDKQIKVLADIIKFQGWRAPITISNRSGFVVRGHGRLAAAKLLGLEQVPIDFQDYENEAAEWADMIADNKIAAEAVIDDAMMGDILGDLKEWNFDMGLTGFDTVEIGTLFEKLNPTVAQEDDFEPILPEIPISKRGDIWSLGKHRLMCGDSTILEDVKTLMDGKLTRFIFTDPPWNVDYGSDTKHPSWKARTILNDKMTTENFNQFLTGAFKAMREVSVAGCMVYVVMSAQEWGNIMQVMDELEFHWSSTIMWVKDSFVLSRKDYHTRYEPIWYGWVDSAPRICPLKDRKQDDAWEIPRPKVSIEHPTMKPIALVVQALINSSHTGDVVLDLFGGSGTTLIAAEQTDRICYMMELDPNYCDVILNRYIKFKNSSDDVFLIKGDKKNKWSEVCGVDK